MSSPEKPPRKGEAISVQKLEDLINKKQQEVDQLLVDVAEVRAKLAQCEKTGDYADTYRKAIAAYEEQIDAAVYEHRTLVYRLNAYRNKKRGGPTLH